MRRSAFFFLAVLSGWLAAAGCATVKTKDAGSPNLALVRNDWLQKFKSKDVNAAVAMYAPDASFLTPDGQAIVGQDALVDLYRTVTATYNSDLELHSRKTEASGDLAYDTGDFAETRTTLSSGAEEKFVGQYYMGLRRDAQGQWKIIEHIWTLRPPAQ